MQAGPLRPHAEAGAAPSSDHGTRRGFLLRALSSSAVLLLPGCGDILAGATSDGPVASRLDGRASLLLPLSGNSAQLGQKMADAASLAAPAPAQDPEIGFADSGSSTEAAVVAARKAVDGGAKMLLGPLFGAQAVAVAAAVGRSVPVVTFSNDTSLTGPNLFVYGVTLGQSAQAILGYAAARGLRRVVTVAPPGALGEQSFVAARAIAGTIGLALGQPVTATDAAGLRDKVAAAAGGSLPDAVYLPSAGPELAGFAEAFAGTEIQILGSAQWAAIAAQDSPALRGAWYAAPDPLRFDPFASAYREAFGEEPGILAGLAFDAVEMARFLGRIGEQTKAGLTREEGFNGILGPYRFGDNGRCQRALAVLKVERGALTLIGGGTV